jgi:hypothetical protein
MRTQLTCARAPRRAAPRHSYVPGVTPRAPGGEAELLEELERLGLVCEPATQLVCVCEVCCVRCVQGVAQALTRMRV